MDMKHAEVAAPLSEKANRKLKQMLQHLKNEERVKYKSLAAALGEELDEIYAITSGRSHGDKELLHKVEDYFARNNISFLGEVAEYKLSGLGNILDKLDIDADRIKESVRLASGKYLLFAKLINKNITVTWFELLGVTVEVITLPTFKAKRLSSDGQELGYKGFYYEYDSSLFIIGHTDETPLVRSLVLVPTGSPNTDRHGVISGASKKEALFVSPCYLKRVDSGASWNDFKYITKENQPNELKDQFLTIVDSLAAREALSMSVERDGG